MITLYLTKDQLYKTLIDTPIDKLTLDNFVFNFNYLNIVNHIMYIDEETKITHTLR